MLKLVLFVYTNNRFRSFRGSLALGSVLNQSRLQRQLERALTKKKKKKKTFPALIITSYSCPGCGEMFSNSGHDKNQTRTALIKAAVKKGVNTTNSIYN